MASVVIVDDSTVQRTIIKKYLERGGHEVIGEAKKGYLGVKLYKDLNPDLIILDIVMPDANGIAILDELINYDPKANIIMCSATAIENVIIETFQLGAKNFLVKPITQETLLRAVSMIFESNKRNSNINKFNQDLF